jgi:hypothetical protein
MTPVMSHISATNPGAVTEARSPMTTVGCTGHHSLSMRTRRLVAAEIATYLATIPGELVGVCSLTTFKHLLGQATERTDLAFPAQTEEAYMAAGKVVADTCQGGSRHL